MDLKTIGENIRRKRERMNFSQAEVAKAVGISRIAYGNIERGKADFKTSTCIKIANVLDMRLDEVFAQESKVLKARFN